MKLNVIVLLFMTMMAQANQSDLECRGRVHTRLSINKNTPNGHLIHNYSSGDLVCPTSWVGTLKTSGTVNCIAYWHIENSMTWVQISSSGQKITAAMRTNRSYGYRLQKLDCKIQ